MSEIFVRFGTKFAHNLIRLTIQGDLRTASELAHLLNYTTLK